MEPHAPREPIRIFEPINPLFSREIKTQIAKNNISPGQIWPSQQPRQQPQSTIKNYGIMSREPVIVKQENSFKYNDIILF